MGYFEDTCKRIEKPNTTNTTPIVRYNICTNRLDSNLGSGRGLPKLKNLKNPEGLYATKTPIAIVTPQNTTTT
jgi:hypothetical protein